MFFASCLVISECSLLEDNISQQVVQDEWTTWKLEYGKSYSSPAEENMRMMVFMENKQLVAQHNARFLKGEETDRVTMNQFGDMVKKELALHKYRLIIQICTKNVVLLLVCFYL